MARPTPIDISEEAGVRYLHFGSDWIQGAMRIARPWSLELQYTRDMMAGLLLRARAGWPRRALLVGLGAGSLAKFLYRHFPDCRLTVVEIDPQVEWVARQYFKLPDDPRRLAVAIADGADYLLAGDSHYDLILVDGFDAGGRAGALDSEPFYQACRCRLSEQGILGINLLGRDRGHKASVARVEAAFPGRTMALPSCDSGNVVVFAAEGEPVTATLDELRGRADALRAATRLDLRPTLTRLQLARSLPEGRLRL